ncbi:hypothetical protein PUW24_22115 [Paenibacillus urinalis]|uniref:Preprotein translocase subunit Tim44 n=1 Tax=Paenibacillus urinalis TaxID=521520 RepID=A0AAX3MT12_9BACL|nr:MULTISPECIES: hypothetical protein [Paenibacillus]WDH80763.1 hypothetical protein PUW23_14525 [Paenibacillus urinalis]WDH96814.1 hypothetical protein PUW24_22115 [Paenibacillus urinalis]WDI00457.1 hypothetical protein PUW25_14265 [Paenibacillus urinalis]GAK39130.1 hypothetical protein TCA2_1618 [Paenibacillus sp. TCA20]
MKKWMLVLLICILMNGFSIAEISATPDPPEESNRMEQRSNIEPFRRGGFRSPRRSYNPGIRNPNRTNQGRQDNNVNNPSQPRTTPARGGFGGLGGLFGGLALGTIIGSLFNPFAGFSLGAPVLSLLSFALWIIVIVAVVRMFRNRRKKEY